MAIADTFGKLKGPTLIAYRILIVVGGLILAGTFVSKREYESDKDAHEKWNNEVIRRLDGRSDTLVHELAEIKRMVERLDDKVDRLVETRRAGLSVPAKVNN